MSYSETRIFGASLNANTPISFSEFIKVSFPVNKIQVETIVSSDPQSDHKDEADSLLFLQSDLLGNRPIVGVIPMSRVWTPKSDFCFKEPTPINSSYLFQMVDENGAIVDNLPMGIRLIIKLTFVSYNK